MKKLMAIKIQWDIDDDKDYDEDIQLPKIIEIPEGMADDDEISDFISDQTGFCHKGFELVEVE